MTVLQPCVKSDLILGSPSAPHELPVECGECSQAGTLLSLLLYAHEVFNQLARKLVSLGIGPPRPSISFFVVVFITYYFHIITSVNIDHVEIFLHVIGKHLFVRNHIW